MAKVDVAFPVLGKQIPADHGYALYGAVSRVIPLIHVPEEPEGQCVGHTQLWPEVGIQTINAHPCGGCMLEIRPNSKLRFRIPSDRIDTLLPLAGMELEIDGAKFRLGAPKIEPLVPAVRLRSRIVIIKGFVDAAPFLAAVTRQLHALGIAGRPGIPYRKDAPPPGGSKSPFVRRTVRIRDKVVVGYAVEVDELTAEESIRLQEVGVGGRRRFGCGLFVPVN